MGNVFLIINSATAATGTGIAVAGCAAIETGLGLTLAASGGLCAIIPLSILGFTYLFRKRQ